MDTVAITYEDVKLMSDAQLMRVLKDNVLNSSPADIFSGLSPVLNEVLQIETVGHNSKIILEQLAKKFAEDVASVLDYEIGEIDKKLNIK